ncbi:hypothetical protein SBI_02608 [Streptomyces bingchenggensis BCW-1]|uniref:Uncharacterized protein n=1 Tax=Streptomyces bingchenggensis (strain BCW-1) TaxID=749414 RepID=D7BZ20_STRBB|nr:MULTISPECIES: hypothetical protein [Streptomyces]ADI05729.1 hypothetical protein SBI_02608 [Streptomyces bingchenggensis BCW-1]
MTGARETADAAVLDRTLAAYGGAGRWASAERIEAELSCGGLLFRWKRGSAGTFDRMHITAEVARQRIRFHGFDGPLDGVLEGHEVRLERDGAVVARRVDARAPFPGGRRLLRWDSLDMMYFLGYALWNYLAFPALLRREDMSWRADGPDALLARFPEHLATHCPQQRFRLDPATGLVTEHEYTAEVFGRSWAHACHLTSEYRDADGVPYASRRRVMPRRPRAGGAMPRPVLIWADIHDYALTKTR